MSHFLTMLRKRVKGGKTGVTVVGVKNMTEKWGRNKYNWWKIVGKRVNRWRTSTIAKENDRKMSMNQDSLLRDYRKIY